MYASWYCEGHFYGTVVFERLPGTLPEWKAFEGAMRTVEILAMLSTPMDSVQFGSKLFLLLCA